MKKKLKKVSPKTMLRSYNKRKKIKKTFQGKKYRNKT